MPLVSFLVRDVMSHPFACYPPNDFFFCRWHTLGNVLLTGSQDGTVWMWEASNGTCMQVCPIEHSTAAVVPNETFRTIILCSCPFFSIL